MVEKFSDYLTRDKIYDDMLMYTESVVHEVGRIIYDYNEECRKAHQKFFLEGVDEEPYLEAASENVFAKLGRKIMELGEKIRNFFTDLIAKIKGVDPTQDDLAKAQKALKDQPDEIKNKVFIALQEGDITLNDIGAYEKNVQALIEQLEKDQIDENSFKAKLEKAREAFNKNGKKIAETAVVAASIITIIPNIVKACSQAKQSMESMQAWCNRTKANLEKNKMNEPSKVRIIINTIANMMGLETTEYRKRVSLLHRFSTALKKIGALTLASKVDAQDGKNFQKSKQILDERRNKYNEKLRDKKIYTNTNQSVIDRYIGPKEREQINKDKSAKKNQNNNGKGKDKGKDKGGK